MNHPLVYLLTRTFCNGALFRLRRLRQPKYLLGAVVGVLYMFLLFGRFYFLPSGPHSHLGRSDPFTKVSFAPQSAALLLFIVVLLFAWIFPGSRAALFFKEAEIAFLFPAPFKRSTLIHYKLIESQLGLITASLVFTFVRGRAFQSAAIPMILGWWIILFTFRLHRLAASFALQRLREHGLADTKRRVLFVVGVCTLVAAVYFTSRNAFSSTSLRDQLIQLPRLLESPAAHWLLLPFRLVVAPCFAATPLEFLAAVGPAAAIMILQYLWVVRADVSFEEAAIARAQWYADFLARRQRGELSLRKPPKDGRATVFALRPTGPIFVAFFWKALLQFGGRQQLRTTFAVIVGIFIVARFAATAFPIGFAATFPLCFGAMAFMVFLIPNQAAMQFRRSIQMMDLLKSYPVRGWQLATGELVA
ncbi:MAG TPA: putative ABC exporter domain-containing protein, partial [Chthoniobacteraceae bacterium]